MSDPLDFWNDSIIKKWLYKNLQKNFDFFLIVLLQMKFGQEHTATYFIPNN